MCPSTGKNKRYNKHWRFWQKLTITRRIPFFSAFLHHLVFTDTVSGAEQGPQLWREEGGGRRNACARFNATVPWKQGAGKVNFRRGCQDELGLRDICFLCSWSDTSWISNTVGFLQEVAPSRRTSAKLRKAFVCTYWLAGWQRRLGVFMRVGWNRTGVKGASEHNSSTVEVCESGEVLRLLSDLIFSVKWVLGHNSCARGTATEVVPHFRSKKEQELWALWLKWAGNHQSHLSARGVTLTPEMSAHCKDHQRAVGPECTSKTKT